MPLRDASREVDSIKTFFTNGRNVAGIGNGYLQDILYQAGVDPRRKVGHTTTQDQKALHKAVKDVARPRSLRPRMGGGNGCYGQ